MSTDDPVRIIIPTRARPFSQVTWKYLSEYWRQRVTFALNDTDYEAMKSIDLYDQAEFLIQPSWVDSIAKKRKWLIETLPYRRVVMLDDDLSFAVRQCKNSTKLIDATPGNVATHMQDLFEVLNTYAHAGWSARQGNNHLEWGWVHNTRMMCVLGYDLEIMRKVCELGRIELREDFDYALQLLRAGCENRVSSMIAVNQKHNSAGGCSLYRTVEMGNANAEQLAELHPGLVKVRQREYKASIPRKEVTVYWKKALKQGRQERGEL